MVAEVEVRGDAFTPSKPLQLSPTPIRNIGGNLSYAIHPDGKRFAVFPAPEASPEEKGNAHVTFLQNFTGELRRKVAGPSKSAPPGARAALLKMRCYSEAMEVQFTREQEVLLAQIASKVGTDAHHLVKSAALRLLDEDARFRAAVREGSAQADQGQFVEEPEMDALFEQMLRA